MYIYILHLYKGSRLCRALLGLPASLAAGRLLDGIPVGIHRYMILVSVCNEISNNSG